MTAKATVSPVRSAARGKPTPVVAMRRRKIRLAAVSAIALGLIWWLAVQRTDAPAAATFALLGGWVLMPAVLMASIPYPVATKLLVIPSTLVTLPLVAMVALRWSPDGMTRLAWAAVAGGVLLGGGLGLWLWLGAFPRPAPLRDPRSPVRWALIVVHVVPIVAGLAVLVAR